MRRRAPAVGQHGLDPGDVPRQLLLVRMKLEKACESLGRAIRTSTTVSATVAAATIR
jgi:hypothetical protein